MILEKQKEAMIITDGDEVNESIGMSLDLDSAQILMQMLSKNLYSDSIGSTIRECASNALDSHRRLNVEDPILVSFKLNNNNEYEFSVEDFGIGLDDEDVKNIISKYGKSTKRNSTTELGMMGLGFKSPLAYSSSFYFICRKDGMERKYMMYEGEEVNTIDLINESFTAERNGVKIIVPVKWSDRESFYIKIQEQLAYFENVYFDVVLGDRIISNDFKILRNDEYQYSELSKDELMHICLDNVYYPIDFTKIGIGALNIPIGLRFSLSDGIYPTPNREAIRYTAEAKITILKKIKNVADNIIKKYNSISDSFEDFDDIHLFYTSRNNTFEIVPGKNINVNHLSLFSNVQINNPKLKNIKYLDLSRLSGNYYEIFNEYKITNILNNGKFKTVKHSWEGDLARKNLKNCKIYIYDNFISTTYKDYYRQNLSSNYLNNYLFVKKVKSFGLFNSSNSKIGYYSLLGLSKIPKEHWREAILEFQSIINTYTRKFIKVDDFKIPKSFIDSRKKLKVAIGTSRRQKMQGDIIVKNSTTLLKYNSVKNCKFVTETWKINNIPKMHKLVIYGHDDDSYKLDKIFGLTDGRVALITLSTKELKVLESLNFKNVISYKKFMEGKSNLFRKIATASLIKRLINENGHCFRKSFIIENISTDLFDMIVELDRYKQTHYRNLNCSVESAIIETATSLRLFDFSIYGKYIKVNKILETMYFINPLLGNMNYNNDKENTIKILVDLCKYHGFKLNKEYYKKPKILKNEIVKQLENQ